MADIAKCRNNECKSKDSCYRFTVPSNPFRQSYSSFQPDEGKDKCEYYWEVKEKK